MEDGSNGVLSETTDYLKNGALSPVMANFPKDTTITSIIETKISDDLTITKINGDKIDGDDCNNYNSSESDALIIDESIPKQKTKRKRSSVVKKSSRSSHENQQQQQHYNPYFNQSLFELSQQHQNILTTATGTVITPTITNTTTITPVEIPSNNTNSVGVFDKTDGELSTNIKISLNKSHKHKRLKKKNSPKLKEYTQYLGLQPSVQFKCSKCTRSGFQSLNLLNEHLVQCNNEVTRHESQQQDNSAPSSSSFKLTRKVFLCSACGTYYENWNLYLHMIEVHRRYLCLYCLGMFSVLDDLCTHIQIKHNLEPGYKENLQEFFNTYSEPCYIVCCNCGKLFNEQENFFYHTCTELITNNNNKISKLTTNKTTIKPTIQIDRHITGDSIIGDNQENNELKIDDNHVINNNEIEPLKNQKEILYSSDSELNFKGFDGNGEAIFLNKTNQLEKTHVKEPATTAEDEEEDEEIVDNDVEEEEEDDDDDEDEDGDDEEDDGDEDDDNDDDDESKEIQEEHIETRKVPKLSLKLKLGSFPEIEQHTNDDNSDDDSDDNDENHQNNNEDDRNEDIIKDESYRDEELVENDKNETIEKEEEVDVDGNQEEKELGGGGGGGEDEGEANGEKSTEIQIAGPNVPIVELQLEQPLDKFDIRLLIQKCLNATAPTCIYCNHARKISVNGKRLGLHAIAQHRYSAIVSSITAEELIPESFITRIKDNLNNLDNVYFNLESNPTRTDEGVTFSHIFECFQCRYSTTIHKELYLHNRKLHTKNLLLCIMCKLNFYSYSELICHLCPGAYIIDYDVQFRCCMCVSDDIPSAFRLMVHLRKRHHVCDVCLEMCHNQYKLSNHVWKHKLHHFCYRCGIAYRNKPDITRHLFWKHGTESVLCKKCLQKKWPHVYHFCVPPTSFLCDECNLTFSRAVSLKVHKRIHNDEKPHCCTIDDCQERFISKKLLAKHELRHREPPPEEIQQQQQQIEVEEENNETIKENQEIQITTDDKQEDKSFDNDEKQQEKIEEKPVQKPKIDVYDLPELNLSESDSSDSEVEAEKKNENPTNDQNKEENLIDSNKDDGDEDINKESVVENCNNDNEIPILEEPSPIDENNLTNTDVVIENIWDNFKNYQANKEKFDNLLTEVESKYDQTTAATMTTTTTQQNEQQDEEQQKQQEQEPLTLEIALLDHDYCIDPENKPDVTFTEVKPDLSQSVDHDYCFGKNTTDTKDATTADVDVEIEKTASVTVTTITTPTITTTTITNAVNDGVVEKNSPQKQISNSSSSNSSSDSDSSSCSCGPNCSCSSSSDSSSSTSDSSDSDSSTEEGRKRQQLRREKRRQRTNNKDNSNNDKNEKIIDIISTTTNATTTLTTTVTTTAATTTITNHLLLNDMPIHESDLETTESETDEEFYDKQPHLIAKKILEEKRNQLLAGIESITTPNGSLLEQPSRSTTPNLPIEVEQQEQQQEEEQRSKKKSKSKKKKKKKKLDNNREFQSINIPTNSNYYHQYYQQQSQTIAPITLSLNRNSPIPSPSTKLSSTPLYTKANNDLFTHQQRSGGVVDDDANLRASKRRRVPNKFYGYSSDEDEMPKWRKTDQTSQIPVQQQFVVPPITIKTGGQISGIQPFSISKSTPNQMKFNSKPSQLQQYYQQYHYGQQQQQQQQQQRMPPVRLKQTKNHQIDDGESEPESNDSVSGGESRIAPKVNPDALYCYCKCPYDEVSEMIGCDAPDCKIEWFHFECVGIMVPPKGHWYCPECRKKRQQKREALKLKAKLQQQQQSPT